VRFGVLGSVEVWDDDGRPLDLGRRKQRALLAMLAVDANRAVSLDSLIDRLWGDEAPARAMGSLHAYISNLRRLLEPDRPARAPATVLVSKAPGYLLVADPDNVDALRFEARAAAGRERLAAGDPAGALASLDEALGLWRGPALADFAYEPFAAGPVARLEELRAAAAEDRVDALLALGRHESVVAEAEAFVGEHPLRERAWGQLMVALYRSGRQAEALRAYQRARAVLADELGIDPGPALQRLEAAVLAQSPDLDGPLTALTPRSRREREQTVDDGLVGRDYELAAADALLADVAGGAGLFLVVSGEAGIGKSALAAEVERRARARGFDAAWGRCPEGAAAPAYWPWAQVARALTDDDLPADLAGLVADAPDSPAGRARLAHAVVSFVRRRARQTPLLLVLDDVQWADEGSLQLLRLLAHELVDVPVLVVATARPPVPSLPVGVRLVLHGLDLDQTAALVARVAGSAGSAHDAAADIFERTAGNPFYATEVARLLAAEHRLERVPSSVREVVSRRVERLPEQAGAVLSVAAVAGPDVDVRVVDGVVGLGLDVVIDLLELAAAAGFMAERPDQAGVYRFSHDLVREAVYESLPGLRRARLHAEAVRVVASLYGDDARHAHELARHAWLAVPATGPAAAVGQLLRSGRVAMNSGAPGQAVRTLRRALELVESMPPSAERATWEARANQRLGQDLFIAHGPTPEGHAAFDRARALAGEVDRAELVDFLFGWTAYAGLWGDVAGSLAAAEQLLALAAETGDRYAEAAGHFGHLWLLWTGRPEEAAAHLAASLELDECDIPPTAPGTYTGVPAPTRRAQLACALSMAGDRAGADAEARAALEQARADGGEWVVAWTVAFAAYAWLLLDDAAAVVEVCSPRRREAASIAYADALIGAVEGWAAARDGGPVDLGLGRLRAERARLAELSDGLFQASLWLAEAGVLLEAGDGAGAAAAVAEARAEVEAHGLVSLADDVERLGRLSAKMSA